MKTISIAGNLGKDAVLRNTPNGDSVTGWSVAVEDRTGKEKATMWFDVSLWGKRGVALEQYLTKGTRVAVSGELGMRQHEGKTYLTIRADQVTLMGGGERREEVGTRGLGSYEVGSGGPIPGLDDDFDAIPF